MEVFSDDEFDIVSNPGHRSLESSIADLDHIPKQEVHEPAPAQAAVEKFDTVSLNSTDIQAYVRRALDSASGRSVAYPAEDRTVRVYVDGTFDIFNAAHALQLRQAKLAFPSVYLIVGIWSDELRQTYQPQNPARVPHTERCEVVRHCRWVDEIMPDAPWAVDDQFFLVQKLDYLALAEGTSVDPLCDKFQLRGYDTLRRIGRVIPTRRTFGVTCPSPTIPVSPAAIPTPLAKPPPLPEAVVNEDDVNEQVERYGVGFG